MSLVDFGKAAAQTLIYTESVTASGSIGTFSFSNQTITLTGTANASDITNGPPGVLLVSDLTATIDISTFGLATFTDSISTYVSQNSTSVGFVDFTAGVDILDTTNAAFSSYNLATAIGPLSGTPTASTGSFYNTTSGALTLSSVSGNARFEATDAPEPSTLFLEVSGLIPALLFGRSRLKRYA